MCPARPSRESFEEESGSMSDPHWKSCDRDDWIDRFWTKVKKGSGCWEWQGPVHGKGRSGRNLPYGKFNIDGKTLVAHRVSFIQRKSWRHV